MFDAKAVIAQVKQGSYPSNWSVYYGNAHWGCFLTTVIFSIGAGLLVSFWNYIFVGIAILLVGGIVAWFLLNGIKTRERSLVVILPEVVIYCRGGNLENCGQLGFGTILNMRLASQTTTYTDVTTTSHHTYVDTTHKTRYWLDVFTITGEYFQWAFEEFDNTAFLCNRIIAAYTAYMHQITSQP